MQREAVLFVCGRVVIDTFAATRVRQELAGYEQAVLVVLLRAVKSSKTAVLARMVQTPRNCPRGELVSMQ